MGDFKEAIRWYGIARDGRWEIFGPKHLEAVRVIDKINELQSTSSKTVNYPTFFYPWFLPMSTFELAM